MQPPRARTFARIVVLLPACVGPPVSRTRLAVDAIVWSPPPVFDDAVDPWAVGTLGLARAWDDGAAPGLALAEGDATTAASTLFRDGGTARRVPIAVETEPDDPTQLQFHAPDGLRPDRTYLLAGSSLLRAQDGTLVTGPSGESPWRIFFRTAPARFVAARIRVLHPVPVRTTSQTLVVGLDRALHPNVPAQGRLSVERAGGAAQAVWRVSCQRRCVVIARPPSGPGETWERWLLPAWWDAHGLLTSPRSLAVSIATDDVSLSPRFVNVDPCRADERPSPPFCLRHVASGVVVRAQSTDPAALRIRWIDAEAWSTTGTRLEATLRAEDVDPAARLRVDLVAASGLVGEARDVGPIAIAEPARWQLTEVLAAPRESTDEFVEFVNRTGEELPLTGLRLVTPSGSSVLGDAVIPADGRVVVVGPRFALPFAASVGPRRIVRLTTTLAGRGLANDGADVWLEDADGVQLDRCPAGDPGLAPRPGTSLVRADRSRAEDDPAAWTYDAGDGATPGGPDRHR